MNFFKRGGKQPVVIEYWVFSNKPSVPDFEKISGRLVSKNPLISIYSREDLMSAARLLSDVRLHIGCSLKSKNRTLFKLDHPIWKKLNIVPPQSEGIIIVRFLDTHSKPHANIHLSLKLISDAIFSIADSEFILDREALFVFDKSDWHHQMSTRWQNIVEEYSLQQSSNGDNISLETFGLNKFGLSDIKLKLNSKDKHIAQSLIKLLCDDAIRSEKMDIANFMLKNSEYRIKSSGWVKSDLLHRSKIQNLQLIKRIDI